ncbi:MAG: NAD(P)/FAD-dependent oxidoreductase [Pseudomonadales bacterium]|jgi:protoporphyrinogen oxidase|nr:NAD(P)/FAD-dependent oxidoreductase [Pseudomonadales bacterium]
MSEEIVILGGGLAGLVAALKLVQRDFHVTLYEARDRLGGKAGSDRKPQLYDANFEPSSDTLKDGVESDHGYHLFPGWYVNMYRLWKEIGLDQDTECYPGWGPRNLKPHDGRYEFLDDDPYTGRARITLLDLLTRPDEEVEDRTLKGFLNSRFYNSIGSVSFGRLLLNALTIREYDVSARSIRNVFLQWFPVMETMPSWVALRGSLGRVFIDRIEAAIRRYAEKGRGSFTLKLNTRVTSLDVQDGRLVVTVEGEEEPIRDKLVLLALPQEVLRALNNDALYALDPAFGRLQYLRSNSFGALDVYFDGEIPELPREHFRLLDSQHALTAFAIHHHWPELKEHYPGHSVLQFVAGDCSAFDELSAVGFLKAITQEIRKYVPEVADRVKYYIPHQNNDAPLFVNDVGIWDYRPTNRSRIPGVYLAGDFVQHSTEVASMEGAVRSGLDAAELIRLQHAAHTPSVEILPPLDPGESWRLKFRLAMPFIRSYAWLRYRVPEYLNLSA